MAPTSHISPHSASHISPHIPTHQSPSHHYGRHPSRFYRPENGLSDKERAVAVLIIVAVIFSSPLSLVMWGRREERRARRRTNHEGEAIDRDSSWNSDSDTSFSITTQDDEKEWKDEDPVEETPKEKRHSHRKEVSSRKRRLNCCLHSREYHVDHQKYFAKFAKLGTEEDNRQRCCFHSQRRHTSHDRENETTLLMPEPSSYSSYGTISKISMRWEDWELEYDTI